MIPYTRDPRQVIPSSAVKIIGLGGAGSNMLERIALDGMDGAELLVLNTDIRTLGSCLAQEKIQLGVNLTKGLGTGGDPELGRQAVLEAEAPIRAAVAGRRIVFICAGLGGGTGSGAAPIVTRIAREEGAFVVVFATMPFAFEGKRRRDQAESALNELAVLSNALVTFDNNRMGELVLAKQGIHDAFIAADQMIGESMKAVIRLVVRPGLINIGLDDLMSALRTNRSRCLFGSGLANGKDRASKALRNALASPLLDQGSLLRDAQSVLVHLCGGENLTLFEIELLMQRLQKFVPENAQVLFGAAVDPAMGDNLSITLISALPEDALAQAPRESLSHATPETEPVEAAASPAPAAEKPTRRPTPRPLPSAVEELAPVATIATEPSLEQEAAVPAKAVAADPASPSLLSKFRRSLTGSAPATAPASLFEDDAPYASDPAPEEKDIAFTNDAVLATVEEARPAVVIADFIASAKPPVPSNYGDSEPDPVPIESEAEFNTPGPEPGGFIAIPRKRPTGNTPWLGSKGSQSLATELEPMDLTAAPAAEPAPEFTPPPASQPEPETPKLKLGIKAATPQSELSLDSTPRGRFEGEHPNVFEGEDLDLPPFLRKKK